MKENDARTIVHALAIAVWGLTFVITVTTISTLSRWRFFTPDGLALYQGTPVMLAFAYMLILIVFGGSIGWGLWRKRTWARVLGAIFCGLVILDSLIFLFAHPLGLAMLVIIVCAAVALYMLAWKKEVKVLFSK